MHAAADAGGRAVRLTLTAGQRHDSVAVPELLDGLEPTVVVADRAYDGGPTRAKIAATGAAACIPPHPTRKAPHPYNEGIYRDRNVVERLSGRLKQFRKVATRFEKRPDTYLGLCWLAAVVTQL